MPECVACVSTFCQCHELLHLKMRVYEIFMMMIIINVLSVFLLMWCSSPLQIENCALGKIEKNITIVSRQRTF